MLIFRVATKSRCVLIASDLHAIFYATHKFKFPPRSSRKSSLIVVFRSSAVVRQLVIKGIISKGPARMHRDLAATLNP